MTLQPSEPEDPPVGTAALEAHGAGGEELAGAPEADELLLRALDEDLGAGDVTTEHSVPPGARARARLVAKAPGVLAGLALFARTFVLCDPRARVSLEARDGGRVRPGQVLARVEGRARALLAAERTALNVLQRLSGIATTTAAYVERVSGLPVRVLDTRKTTPGMRVLEKYAVRCGGGANHRMGLWDEALLKENHIALAGRPLEEVLAELRRGMGPRGRITCEAESAEQARGAVRGGADVVLLDDMAPAEMAALCPELRALALALGRTVLIEASGGVDEASVRRVAESGVDRVSVGALTHSARALDLSLALEPLPAPEAP